MQGMKGYIFKITCRTNSAPFSTKIQRPSVRSMGDKKTTLGVGVVGSAQLGVGLGWRFSNQKKEAEQQLEEEEEKEKLTSFFLNDDVATVLQHLIDRTFDTAYSRCHSRG